MQFRDIEIELARRLRELGLPWQPQAGHFVLDETGLVDRPSPFQDGVYFILNFDYFMELAGGVEQFKQIMTWLPTWSDARLVLQSLGVADDDVADVLHRERAIQEQTELATLYRLIESTLRHKAAPDNGDDVPAGR